MSIYIVFGLIAIAAVTAFFIWRDRQRVKRWARNRTAEVVKTLTVETRLANGCLVRSQRPLSSEQITGITEAFHAMDAAARRNGYTERLEPAHHTIYVFPTAREYDAAGNYSPAFKVYFDRQDEYDETMYDQEPGQPGGWLYAAEQVLDLPHCVFVIAESHNPQFVKESVYNGLDHLILYHNDPNRYYATRFHGNGGSHPIIS